jgi:class 3 adenylate cyclase/TolB-like protein
MDEGQVTHRLAAILYADVFGYSRLTELDEIGTHRQLSASLDLIADRIHNAGGEVVHYAGDAVLARFESIVSATNCAIGIQDAIHALGADLEPERRLLFRIGINFGEVIVDRADIYGEDVNLAARLEALAEPGGICISESVLYQIRDKVDAQFEDLGEQKLKNIKRPVKAFRSVCAACTSAEGNRPRERIAQLSKFSRLADSATGDQGTSVFVRADPPSIMIVPFKNLSGDAEQAALVDGFRLSIQSSLVKLSGLFLINAPASECYRNSEASPSQVGNELGVRYVIDGGAQFSGDRVRVTVQLTDAPAGQIVWAERYDRIVDDIFNVQDEITTEVAISLEVKLLSDNETLGWWKGLPNPAVREPVLRGINHLYKGTRDDNASARICFEEVSRICPDSPQALAIIAFTHWLEVMRGWSEVPEHSTGQAVTYAQKAIILGDPDGFAHVVMGSVRLNERCHDEALALSEKAASVRVSCPLARAVHSNVLHFSGQHERAIEFAKAAVKHARIYPPWMVNLLSASYRDCGNIPASISVANECLRVDPINLESHVLLCTDYYFSGQHEEACRIAREISAIDPSFSVSRYAATLPYKDGATLGRIVEALRETGLTD